VLQHAHAIFIGKRVVTHVVATGEGSCKLGVLSKGPPFSLFDMLILTREGSRT
jgi:hypothetical protein